MAKSLREQIEQVGRDEELVRKAHERRAATINKIVAPIAEKIGGMVSAKLAEDLKADVSKAADIDMSREFLKAAVDEFVAKLFVAREVKKPGKAKAADKVGQVLAGDVTIEG